MENNEEFIETATVFGNKYGTNKRIIEETLDSGQSMVLDIDWQGARKLKKSSYCSVSIFILPPSLKTLNERLQKREITQMTLKEECKKPYKKYPTITNMTT